MPGVDKKAFGAEIKTQRTSRGWSLVYLAAMIPRAYGQKVANWEKGQVPDASTVQELEEIFEIQDHRLLRFAGYAVDDELADRVEWLEGQVGHLHRIVARNDLIDPDAETGGQLSPADARREDREWMVRVLVANGLVDPDAKPAPARPVPLATVRPAEPPEEEERRLAASSGVVPKVPTETTALPRRGRRVGQDDDEDFNQDPGGDE